MPRKYEYRRYLPHYQKPNRALFVTFNTFHRWILPADARDIVYDSCLHANGRTCVLHGFVVMPDHVHLVLTPSGDDNGPLALHEIMRAIKSESVHRINKLLRRKGPVWQDESLIMFFGRTRNLSGLSNTCWKTQCGMVW